ncbi:MAG: hypothetical protein LBB41_00235 [Prevotellaceae bacterium]|jgi:hypothetical protein|nr:hypothetical protein [Prevotellaceae bacterium]
MTSTNTTLTAPDVKYDISQNSLVAFLVSTKTGKFTLTSDEVNKIKSLAAEWSKQYGFYKDLSTRTSVVILEKNNARKALTSFLRFLIDKYISGNDLVTDADRETLGLTIKDVDPTPIHIPDFVPELDMDSKKGGEVVLRLNYPEHEKKRAIPFGANGFEVYILWGETVNDETKFNFLTLASKNPFRIQFPELTNVGKKVNFLVRFYNNKSQVGKWSNIVTGILI